MAFILIAWLAQASDAVVVARCEVLQDQQARLYELRRDVVASETRWALAMRSRETGASAVLLPLPDARPTVARGRLSLEYRTQNGGRDVMWRIAPSGATLDVHANFELEVNIEADLDPRVELMNTDGPISNLSCVVEPPP